MVGNEEGIRLDVDDLIETSVHAVKYGIGKRAVPSGKWLTVDALATAVRKVVDCNPGIVSDARISWKDCDPWPVRQERRAVIDDQNLVRFQAGVGYSLEPSSPTFVPRCLALGIGRAEEERFHRFPNLF